MILRYQQKFDLEGDTGIVVRGIGTAMALVKLSNAPEKPMTSALAVGGVNKETDPQQKS